MLRPLALLLGCWLLVALLGLVATRLVDVQVDLDFAMPTAKSPEANVIAAVLRRGAEGSPILVGIEGDDAETASALSDSLKEALRRTGMFRLVLNGSDAGEIEALGVLFDWRYLLNPLLPRDYFSAESLRVRITSALSRLQTAEGAPLARIFPSDPTLRSLDVGDAWTAGGPGLAGPWALRGGATAILLLQPSIAPANLEQAVALLDVVRNAYAALDNGANARLRLSGPTAFTVSAAERIRSEVVWLGVASTVLLSVVVLLTYRSILVLAVAFLPAAIGALAAAFAVQGVYGQVHGITLAFGSTVLGIAVDYPIHMMSHSAPEHPLRRAVAAVWSTVRLGIAATAVAFVPLLWSSVPGLSQLGLFAIVGIVTAGFATRILLPALLPDFAAPRLTRAWVNSLPRGRIAWRYGASIGVALLAVIVVGRSGAIWQDDLLALSPTVPEDLAFDDAARAALGAPDVRYLLAVEGKTTEDVLQGLEALANSFAQLVRVGGVASFESPSRYLPSIAAQRQVQSAMPDPGSLRSTLATATRGVAIREGALEPFIAAVAASRDRPPLTPASLEEAGFGWLLQPLLLAAPDGWIGLAVPRGLSDPDLLRAVGRERGNVTFVDTRAALRDIVVAFRDEALLWLLFGLVIALALMAGTLRSVRATARTALPVVFAMAITIAVLLVGGERLSPFHLLALVLIAGLAVDYALVLGRLGRTADEWGPALRGVLVSALTTAIPFSMLALSEVPVLHQIGLTVSVGTTAAFVFAYLLHNEDAAWRTG